MQSDWFSNFDEIECIDLEIEMIVADSIYFKCGVDWTFHVV